MAHGESTKIAVRSLSKVFGPQPELALRKRMQGWDRERILSETGNLVAIDNVSFEIDEGELFVVMGLSGSGKSTLIRCLNRLVEPTSGQVLIDGQDITKFSSDQLRDLRLRRVAMVFQHFALLPDRSVRQNVEFGLKLRGLPAAERREKAMEKLRQVGLAEWAEAYPKQLSGGMQQRVGLARSLAVEPDILLMDEAFSALDPLIRHEMQLELLQLQRTMKRTVVFITHDLDEALLLGNRIAILNQGHLVQLGTPQEILESPADKYVASFVRHVDRGKVFRARDVCIPVPNLSVYSTPAEASQKMKRSGVAAALAMGDRGEICGIVDAELLHLAENGAPLADAVVRDFAVVEPDTKLNAIYAVFASARFVVVADQGGSNVLGVIGSADILRKIALPTLTAAPSEVGTGSPEVNTALGAAAARKHSAL